MPSTSRAQIRSSGRICPLRSQEGKITSERTLELDLAEARDGLKAKRFTATELATAHIEAIEAANATINAYVLTTPELALAQAKESDKRLAAGDARPLEGLPLGHKDLFCTKGVRTTACSKILDGFVPTYESTVGQNLWDAGAVMLGKLNNDEFAMGSSNETSAFGPVISPWRRKGKTDKLVPGGSSGGSSAAVSAGLCLAATATDTGGSIRQPAALTGTVGIKPTYGRCSRWGIVAFASSLDQAGPITKTVRDAAMMLGAMASHDPKDSTSVDAPVPNYEADLAKGIKGLRVGVPKEYRVPGMSKEIEALWDQASPGSRPRARPSTKSACRIRSTRCPLITSWHPPRRPRTSRATTACATASASPAATSSTPMRKPAPRASVRKSAAAF